MVAAALTGCGVDVGAGRREDPLPGELTPGLRVLPLEGQRQLDPAPARTQVGDVASARAVELASQRLAGDGGQQRHPIAIALAGADH